MPTDNIPSFKIGAGFYTAMQIVDKTLYARKPVIVFSGNNSITVAKGAMVGKIYSWANLNGKLHFLLYGPTSTNYSFVLYDETSFSESALEAQGALTVEEEQAAKDEAGKSELEKFLDSLGISNIGDTLKWALPVGIVALIGIKLYGEVNRAKSLKN